MCRVTMYDESDDASGVGVTHAMIKMPLLIACYALERCLQYGWDCFYLLCSTKQDMTLKRISSVWSIIYECIH